MTRGTDICPRVNGRMVAIPAPLRFWPKVMAMESGCWLWLGVINNKGYGQFGLNRRMVFAHRWAYEALVGPIPDGKELDHLCRTPACVNPHHLQAVDHRTNTIRGNGFAQKALQTQCKRGHPFDLLNTIYKPDGRRECRTCKYASNMRYHYRKKAAA